MSEALRVCVAYAAPGIESIEWVTLPRGARVADAIAASGVAARAGAPATLSYAIHGQRATPDTPLADGDRVEIVRPLRVDAKARRRARAEEVPLPRTRKVKRRGPSE